MKKLFVIICMMLTTLVASAQKFRSAPEHLLERKRAIVAYFSATGTTEAIAKQLAKEAKCELYAITPAKAYTSADLDWHNKKSRSSVEMADKKSRPALKAKKDLSKYDVVYLGYPIWWGVAPRIINTFIEQANMNGKIVVPFVTSGSSPVTKSVDELKATYPKVKWQKGYRLNNATKSDLKAVIR